MSLLNTLVHFHKMVHVCVCCVWVVRWDRIERRGGKNVKFEGSAEGKESSKCRGKESRKFRVER